MRNTLSALALLATLCLRRFPPAERPRVEWPTPARYPTPHPPYPERG